MQHLDKQPYAYIAAFVAKLSEVGHRLLPTVKSRVKCDQCQDRFTSRERLAKHRQSRHSNQIHTRAECDNAFVSKLRQGKSQEESAHCKKLKYRPMCMMMVQDVFLWNFSMWMAKLFLVWNNIWQLCHLGEKSRTYSKKLNCFKKMFPVVITPLKHILLWHNSPSLWA